MRSVKRLAQGGMVLIFTLVPITLTSTAADAENSGSTGITHGYAGVTELTQAVRAQHPPLGLARVGIPVEQLIRGGPLVPTDSLASSAADR